jgi:3D-(3,5/4)-trihydroxycyclohexane-1,2-dione acylhydrolase (decyclizing)
MQSTPKSSVESVRVQPDTVRLTLAQALIRFLQVQYSERDGQRHRLVPYVAGIFGHGNVTGLGQALEECAEELPYIQARNEQSMVHMAIGYARTMGRRATIACAASVGPGSTNMITGAATATINRLPVLLLPADYYASRRQGNVLQQVEHPISADLSVNDSFRPVSRYFDRLTRPDQLLGSLPEAMRVLTDPADTGAVTIALPQDVATEAFDYPRAFFEPRVWPIERRPPTASRISELASALAQSKAPLIVAGGGVHFSEASSELESFATEFGIPVAETFAGKGAIHEESPILLGGIGVEGNPAANSIASEADLILCMGTRLSDFTTGSRSLFQHPDVRFVGVNVNARDAAKLGAMQVLADLRETLVALGPACRDLKIQPNTAYLGEIRQRLAGWRGALALETTSTTAQDAAPSMGQIIGAIQEKAQRGDIIVAASGGPVGDLLKAWDATAGRQAQLEFGNSCMGHELPAALGTRLASGPTGEVVAFIGDGTFLMNPSELVTGLQEGLKITVVIADNHGFQVIRRLQMARVGRPFGNELRHRDPSSDRLEGPFLEIDLATIAEGMGARSWRVQSGDQLRRALDEARGETSVCVIVVETDPYKFLPASNSWWDAAPPEVSQDDETQRLRATYERDRQSQRYFG